VEVDRLPSRRAGDAFTSVCDFERFPPLCDAVRSVEATPLQAGRRESSWQVDFRGSTLAWRELDIIDEPSRILRFELLDGDLQRLDGSWSVRQEGDDAVVTFHAELDVGSRVLSPIIEPIAQRVLKKSIVTILDGLFGDISALDPGLARGREQPGGRVEQPRRRARCRRVRAGSMRLPRGRAE
jgi:ribosome-associated toxin RatA of RatAB toxin-antitoxin module